VSRRTLGRRAFLRGAGSVAVGLPLCATVEGLGVAQQAAPTMPPRCLSFYFGNGLPRALVADGYAGALSPLSPLSGKLAMLRGLQLPISGGAAQMHWRGTSRFGIGITTQDESTRAGESLDNALHAHLGAGTRLLNANLHGRTQGTPATRWFHSWRRPYLPNPDLDTPIKLFDAIFGTRHSSAQLDTATALSEHLEHSILDTVVDQYEHLRSERSGYSEGTRALIADHLELIRELEKQAALASLGSAVCDQEPPEPPPSDLVPLQYCTADLCPDDLPFLYGPEQTANWNRVWPIYCELYALALRCGSTRFGTVGFTGSGDRYPIPELREEGVDDSVHTLAHEWRADADNGFSLCVRWTMEKIALFLQTLDDPRWPDPDGGTVLDNSVVMIGTELGTATDGQHHADFMTYFLAGGAGVLRHGIHDLPGRSDVDLYSTIAHAYGLGERFGDPADFQGRLDLFKL
jgi:hypothetical protein